ncbi:hypothetical protein HKD37_06G017689 [Glycine soja]
MRASESGDEKFHVGDAVSGQVKLGQLGPGPRPRHKPSGDEVIREVEVAEAVTGSKVCEGKLAGEVVVREVEEGRDVRMGRKRVPEREAPPRSMEVTSPEEEEQVIARHAHGDGACGSQSERKLKGSEETCKCLKCINRSASEFVASAAVMMNKAVTRNLTTLLADHDIFLLSCFLSYNLNRGRVFEVSSSLRVRDPLSRPL